uniref:Uncharacterized protein n=1 Tax=Oryza brachyantha TaxID=4533 RepID=J3LF09_ORYBR
SNSGSSAAISLYCLRSSLGRTLARLHTASITALESPSTQTRHHPFLAASSSPRLYTPPMLAALARCLHDPSKLSFIHPVSGFLHVLADSDE